jgi:hypothetical protein
LADTNGGKALAKSRRQGWSFGLRGSSADGGQTVVGHIVPDGVGEADGLTAIDGRGINASSLELVDEWQNKVISDDITARRNAGKLSYFPTFPPVIFGVYEIILYLCPQNKVHNAVPLCI